MGLDEWSSVLFDDTNITFKGGGRVAQIRWDSITRVCYNVSPMPWGMPDEILVFTSERPECYAISEENYGADELWDEILRRGLFDAQLAVDMKKKDGVFCWPPPDQEAGTAAFRTRIALVQAILQYGGLSSVVSVLQKQASLADSQVSAAADEAIDVILADPQNIKRLAQVLVDPLVNELRDPISTLWEDAAGALGTAICFGGKSVSLIGTLVDCLVASDPSSRFAERLTGAFWQAALQGHDLGPAVNALEQARASPIKLTRLSASEALSNYYCRLGIEPPITPIKGLKLPIFKSGGDWDIQVKYRRKFALSDDPVAKENLHFPCAACGRDDTRCLWDEQMLEPYTSVTGEVLCQKCGKYSTYEYHNLSRDEKGTK